MTLAANSRSSTRRPSRRRAFTAAEFFAGIGLVRLALERQGWRVVFANDIDPAKQEMYEHNFGAEHFKLGDIHKLDPDELPTCDLFTASFPCNDLSIAGAWAGLNGKESSAFWGFIDLLKGMGDRKPPLVMLKNVLRPVRAISLRTAGVANDLRPGQWLFVNYPPWSGCAPTRG